MREVTHRSKNLLAIVMSLAAQTSRTARTVDDFLDRFNGRVQSMSRSQDLITEANWRGAQLSELIATQVESFAARGRQQVGLDGRDYYLKPNAALYVGLALHELAVNSVQTGALATPNGRVSVAVMALPGFNDQTDPTAPALSLTWSETGEGPIEEPDREEFGHVLLSRLVPLAVGGASELSGGPDGLRYALTLQRREIE
ncbi:sensor histidine kinase [Bauldia litoralis]|uniref:sensor histidine kinase n=1 Tax=Bauldia litoralis TaxID=665467 RepID=UPI0032640D94